MTVACLECGETQMLYLGSGGTMMGWGWVPEGHKHDPNFWVALYKCKNGHKIEIHYRKACPIDSCEFNLGVA